jgi:hypothetical protein
MGVVRTAFGTVTGAVLNCVFIRHASLKLCMDIFCVSDLKELRF